MRIKWHYYCGVSTELQEALHSGQVTYGIYPSPDDELECSLMPPMLYFDIYEDDPCFQDVKRRIPDTEPGIRSFCFSEAERNAARWRPAGEYTGSKEVSSSAQKGAHHVAVSILSTMEL